MALPAGMATTLRQQDNSLAARLQRIKQNSYIEQKYNQMVAQQEQQQKQQQEQQQTDERSYNEAVKIANLVYSGKVSYAQAQHMAKSTGETTLAYFNKNVKVTDDIYNRQAQADVDYKRLYNREMARTLVSKRTPQDEFIENTLIKPFESSNIPNAPPVPKLPSTSAEQTFDRQSLSTYTAAPPKKNIIQRYASIFEKVTKVSTKGVAGKVTESAKEAGNIPTNIQKITFSNMPKATYTDNDYKLVPTNIPAVIQTGIGFVTSPLTFPAQGVKLAGQAVTGQTGERPEIRQGKVYVNPYWQEAGEYAGSVIGFAIGGGIARGVTPRYATDSLGYKDMLTGKEVKIENYPKNIAARTQYTKQVKFREANPVADPYFKTDSPKIRESIITKGKSSVINQIGEYEVIQEIKVPAESKLGMFFKSPSKWKTKTITYEQKIFTEAPNTFGQFDESFIGKQTGVAVQGKKGMIAAVGEKRAYTGFVTADKYQYVRDMPSVFIKEKALVKVAKGGKKATGGSIVQTSRDSGFFNELDAGIKDISPEAVSQKAVDLMINVKPKKVSGLMTIGEEIKPVKDVVRSSLSQTEIEKIGGTIFTSKTSRLLNPYEEAGRMIRAGELKSVEKARDISSLGVTERHATIGKKGGEFWNVEPSTIKLKEGLPTNKIGSFIKFGTGKYKGVIESDVLAHELLHVKNPLANEGTIMRMSAEKSASGNKFLVSTPKPTLDIGLSSWNIGDESILYGVSKDLGSIGKGKNTVTFGYSAFVGKKPKYVLFAPEELKGFTEFKGKGKSSSNIFDIYNAKETQASPSVSYKNPKSFMGQVQELQIKSEAPSYINGGQGARESIYAGKGQYDLGAIGSQMSGKTFDLSSFKATVSPTISKGGSASTGGFYFISALGTEGRTSYIPKTDYSIKTENLLNVKQISIIKSIRRTESGTDSYLGIKPAMDVNSLLKNRQAQNTDQILKTDQLLKQKQLLKTEQMLKQRQGTKTQLKLRVTPKVELKLRVTPKVEPIKPIVPIIIVPPIKTTIYPSELKAQNNFAKTKAYQTLIKRFGQWRALEGLSTKGLAIKKGEKYALETLGASFKVIPTKKYIKGMNINYVPSESSFRQFKIRRGMRVPLSDEWIQLARRRLSSSGERREIRIARRTNRRIKFGRFRL